MPDHAARLFLCSRCCSQVVLCSPCDRGQRYCGQACSKATRKDHQRGAGRRYQTSSDGSLKHAERSRRWRLSQKQKLPAVAADSAQSVTHQGLQMPDAPGSVAQPLTTSAPQQPVDVHAAIHTHCWKCAAPLQPWLRQRFLCRSRPRHVAKENSPSAVSPSHVRPPPQAE
jgi:hypothetical protein